MQLALFQCAGGGLDPAQRLERLEDSLHDRRQAGRDCPELVLCSELFASGYYVGDALLQRAEAQDGPVIRRLGQIAKRFDTAIVCGYPEQGEHGVYNAAAFVAADGSLLANHRKCINAPGGYEDRYFLPGDTPTLVDYAGWRIALQICYEIEFPEAARRAALAGAQLILAPTALGAEWEVVASRVVPARAFENGVWVAYANHAGHENGIDYLGGSKIVAPDGVIEADAGPGETLTRCVIDLARVHAAQRRLPYLRDREKLPG